MCNTVYDPIISWPLNRAARTNTHPGFSPPTHVPPMPWRMHWKGPVTFVVTLGFLFSSSVLVVQHLTEWRLNYSVQTATPRSRRLGRRGGVNTASVWASLSRDYSSTFNSHLPGWGVNSKHTASGCVCARPIIQSQGTGSLTTERIGEGGERGVVASYTAMCLLFSNIWYILEFSKIVHI